MRKFQLVVICIKACKQIKTLVERAIGLGVWFVDLIEHHNRSQPEG